MSGIVMVSAVRTSTPSFITALQTKHQLLVTRYHRGWSRTNAEQRFTGIAVRLMLISTFPTQSSGRGGHSCSSLLNTVMESSLESYR